MDVPDAHRTRLVGKCPGVGPWPEPNRRRVCPVAVQPPGQSAQPMRSEANPLVVSRVVTRRIVPYVPFPTGRVSAGQGESLFPEVRRGSRLNRCRFPALHPAPGDVTVSTPPAAATSLTNGPPVTSQTNRPPNNGATPMGFRYISGMASEELGKLIDLIIANPQITHDDEQKKLDVDWQRYVELVKDLFEQMDEDSLPVYQRKRRR